MAKTFTCRDVGVNCDWKARGNDEAEIMRKIKDHARAVHKMDPIPSDLEQSSQVNLKAPVLTSHAAQCERNLR